MSKGTGPAPANDEPLPLSGLPAEGSARPQPLLAPAWVSLGTAWLGLATLVAAIILPLMPGSQHPREELERHGYSTADKFLLVPVYGSILTIFLGTVVLWQMRRQPRPLEPALVAQRTQAWVGMAMAAAAVVVFYAYVHFLVAWRSAGSHI